jgi:glycosyltransferase involved in cell wall biosynthesis
VPDLLADCAVLVLASHREGLPIAILEGMAAGLPIVCSQVGGCQEAVIDAESGFLVPPYDTQRLAEAIYALVSNRDLAHSFGETGRQRVSKYFDISENAAQIQRLYLDLLSRKNGNHN